MKKAAFALFTVVSLSAMALTADQAATPQPATQPRAVIDPEGLAAAADGSVLVVDKGSLRIWRIVGKQLQVVAGSGRGGDSPDGVPAVDARLSDLAWVAADGAGNVYFTDHTQSHRARIRKVDRGGRLSTLAETAPEGTRESPDGNNPGYISGLAADAAGSVYFSERMLDRIRRIDAAGVVTTYAEHLPADLGMGLAVRPDGTLLVPGGYDAFVMAIDARGAARVVAGTGDPGCSGDGGPAARAQFSRSPGIGLDSKHRLLIADMENDRLRRVGSDGVVSTIARAKRANPSGGCTLCPRAVAVAGDGTTYVSAPRGLRRVARGGAFRSTFALPPDAFEALRPTRAGFFRELLEPEYSPATRLFDDYTEGSYHVDKIDTYKGLVEAAQAAGRTLLGVLVVGPSGGLWSYGVTAFFEEGDQVRANRLMMPHARITWKGTALLTRTQYADIIASLRQAADFRPSPPPATDEVSRHPESAYSVLLADLSPGRPQVSYADVDLYRSGAATDKFIAALNALETLFQTTYGG